MEPGDKANVRALTLAETAVVPLLVLIQSNWMYIVSKIYTLADHVTFVSELSAIAITYTYFHYPVVVLKFLSLLM